MSTTELKAAGVTDILQVAVAFRGKELWVKQGDYGTSDHDDARC